MFFSSKPTKPAPNAATAANLAAAIEAITAPASVKECWIQTLTGGVFHPLAPKQDEIRIQDIAGALSKLCRYAGHCVRFYSVAEHCVLMARIAPKEHKLTALLHDASEAYLVDVPKPLKPWLVGYVEIENRLMEAISAKYGTEWPLPKTIKFLDTSMLSDERYQIMAKNDTLPNAWGNLYKPLGIRLELWGPDRAEFEFLSMFHTLRKGLLEK